MASAKFFLTMLAACATVAPCAAGASAEPPAHIDHIILGVADLQQGIASFEHLTGVRPVYGGKHPVGTHNALVSLGGRTYLELIAVQPGVSPPADFADLPRLEALTPIGWAITSHDTELLRSRLGAAGFALTDASEGSRDTAAGTTLRWRTFGLQNEFAEAPFFIVWAPESPHPSSTSPTGCTLGRWSVAGPNGEVLERLRGALQLPVDTATTLTSAMRLSLECPKGAVLFESTPQQP